MADNAHFLDTLITAFEALHNEAEFSTSEFVVACTNLLPIFDGLGSIFAAFPKQDLQAKVPSDTLAAPNKSPPAQAQSLHQVQDTHGTLRAVVEEDKKVCTPCYQQSAHRMHAPTERHNRSQKQLWPQPASPDHHPGLCAAHFCQPT